MGQAKILSFVILLGVLIGCLDAGASARQGNGDFILFLTANKKCPMPGETIHFKATVTNTSGQTRVIELEDRPIFDLVIGNPDNGWYRWSTSKPLTSELTRLELRPSESKNIEVDWVTDEQTQGAAAFFISDPRFPEVPIMVTLPILPYCPGIGP